MMSKKLIQSMVFKEFFGFCTVIDVPVEAGGDEVVATMSAKTLRIGARSDLMIVGLAEGFTVVLAKVVVDVMIGTIIDVGVDVLTELGIVVAFAQVIVLEVFVTASCVEDVRAGVWTGTVTEIEETFIMPVGAVAGVLIALLADTAIGFVTDIGATMADREFIDNSVSLEDALRCC